MSNQHYFDVPFGFSGDVTPIPDPLQTGGTVSFTEGWNYNYQRNLSTDPAALPIDRSTMNWLFLQITQAIQQLQGGTTPEFILASQNGGTAYPYGAQAEVLWSASGNAPFVKYVNISGGTNTNTPSASDPAGSTTGWQVACDPISTSAQASAGTNNASIMTPLLVAQQTALRALLAGSTTQVFNVGPATASTHAPQAQQVQADAFNYGGVASGTVNAITASLTPAPTAYSDNLEVIVRTTGANTGAVTLNLNSLGAQNVVGQAHAALVGSELAANGFALFKYSSALTAFVLVWSTGGAEQVGSAVFPGQIPQWAQAWQYTSTLVVSGAITLTASVFGQYVSHPLGNAGGYTITLPPAGSGNVDKTFAYYNSTTGNVTLSAGNFNSAYGNGASIVIPSGGSAVFISDGTSFNAIGGSASSGGMPRMNAAGAAFVGDVSPLSITGGASGSIVIPGNASQQWMYYYSNQNTAQQGAGVAAGGTTLLTGAAAGGAGISVATGFAIRTI